ncbi:hypothetical protein OsJ_11084 [Oryza sativa Japonica Group]|uniref:Uncharacterized protein n=1 Tax=Oryza sativa subsp. japonica TaxID=39947 RepID=B9F8R6_ORYSJ|nr:hypothetical protein OsJ_11084 [Oryza sativa Japonica Group]
MPQEMEEHVYSFHLQRSQLLPDLYLLDPSDLDPIVERRGELESRIEVMRRGRGVGKELKIQGRSDRESSPLIG